MNDASWSIAGVVSCLLSLPALLGWMQFGPKPLLPRAMKMWWWMLDRYNALIGVAMLGHTAWVVAAIQTGFIPWLIAVIAVLNCLIVKWMLDAADEAWPHLMAREARLAGAMFCWDCEDVYDQEVKHVCAQGEALSL
jgi:hypothetical protein